MLGRRSHPLLTTIGRSKDSDLSIEEDCEPQSAANAFNSGKLAFLPQQVVVGFDVRQDPKPFDPCESPRSVLDLNVLPRDNRPPGGPFRTFLGSLKNRGSHGVGLAIVVELHAEEKQSLKSLSPAGLAPSTDSEQAQDHRQQLSQPIAIGLNYPNPCKQSASRLSKDIQFAGAVEGDLSSIESATDTAYYLSSWKDYLEPSKADCGAEDRYNPVPSIFSVASLPSSPDSFGSQPRSFLDVCALCERAFSPGKDVFMYRGDQAFCSDDCRDERMKMEEYKEKARALYSKV